VQVRILPVGEAHREAARALAQRFRDEGFRVEVDDRDEKIGKRVRDAEVEKVPYVLVHGEREIEQDAVSVRKRGEEGLSSAIVDGLLRELATLRP
jgi:threonyl-tRNA synthetase